MFFLNNFFFHKKNQRTSGNSVWVQVSGFAFVPCCFPTSRHVTQQVVYQQLGSERGGWVGWGRSESGFGFLVFGVWFWFGVGLGLVWVWFGVGLGLVWCWFGIGLGLIWCWFGIGLGLVWCWFGFGFGVGLGLVWCWFGFGFGVGLGLVCG